MSQLDLRKGEDCHRRVDGGRTVSDRALFDLSVYERAPEFTGQERDALRYVAHHGFGRGLEDAYLALDRLVRPIRDALQSLDLGEKRSPIEEYCGSRRRIVLDMFHRQKTLWQFSEREWEQTVLAATDHKARMYTLVVAYCLGGLSGQRMLDHCARPGVTARRMFGAKTVDAELGRVRAVLEGWGYVWGEYAAQLQDSLLCRALLLSRSARLESIDLPVLEELWQRNERKSTRQSLILLSRALYSLGVLSRPLEAQIEAQTKAPNPHRRPSRVSDREPVREPGGSPSAEWEGWCRRWFEHSTLVSRHNIYRNLLRVGVWLAENHPEIKTPEQWDSSLALEYVAAVDRLMCGEWGSRAYLNPEKLGKPLQARSKSNMYYALRRFFQDCQGWGWLTVRFDPSRCLRTPRSIWRLIGPDPKVIEDPVWAKLVAAGIDLRQEDLPESRHPIEMVRALAAVWLFTGLRPDEIRRLRLGCVRTQSRDTKVAQTEDILEKDSVCFLDVPVNKTSTAFTKPVHPIVGQRIGEWERVRPTDQHPALDEKTNETVNFLFYRRNSRVGYRFINGTLISVLCRKAGVPEEDARGRITGHRARATIASQLTNGPDPWTLPELQLWLGHKGLSSTRHYVRVNPTRLAKKYADSGYLERNMATVEALLDVEALTSGKGEGALYYDLGHGLCANPYWHQCPYRMACVKCPMYVPGEEAQYIRAKKGIRRMLETVPMTDEEQRAAEGDEQALKELLGNNPEIPMPADPTSRQPIIPLSQRPHREPS